MNKRSMLWGITAGILCFCFFYTPVAMAEEKAGEWRGTYDLIMMWINFCILAFVIVKFGKNPLMNFLHGQKDIIAREIDQLEEEKKRVLANVRKTYQELENSESRLSGIKAKVIEQGEKRKAEIIEEAKHQSQILLNITKEKAEGKIKREKEKLKAELIDRSVALALEKIPAKVTEEDHQMLVENYLAHV